MYEDEKNLMNSDDEVVNIEINKSRLRKINDKDIKDRFKQIGNINVRMTRIVLSTSEDEYLVTNIPYDEMDTNDNVNPFLQTKDILLKQAYTLEWKIMI